MNKSERIKFFNIRGCSTALERQVREAVRIQQIFDFDIFQGAATECHATECPSNRVPCD